MFSSPKIQLRIVYSIQLALLLNIVGVSQESVRIDASAPPSRDVEALVIAAFESSHDGWSVDEVLLDDRRRADFIRACGAAVDGVAMSEDSLCSALLHVRKAGGRLPKATRRSPSKVTEPNLLAVAEMAARRLADELEAHTDSLLVSTQAREAFDKYALGMDDSLGTYELRKAALQLRKSRRLEPELLTRVTDWKRDIRDFAIQDLRDNLSTVPQLPGIYLFADTTGYLYIGQAQDLRQRLTSHLAESDRKSLANYLADADKRSIRVELHIFQADSPAQDLRVRRAYESELIRTRAPKFNLAP